MNESQQTSSGKHSQCKVEAMGPQGKNQKANQHERMERQKENTNKKKNKQQQNNNRRHNRKASTNHKVPAQKTNHNTPPRKHPKPTRAPTPTTSS
jgi:hypothetical protein